MLHPRSFIIFSLILIMAFIGLGSWQLIRKQEKETLISALEEGQKRLPEDVDALETPTLFQPLFAVGHFLNRPPFFLSAKTYQGKSGFYVLDIFQTQEGKYLLVQRGWSQTQTVSSPVGILKIEGIARVPSTPTVFQPQNTPPTYFWIDLSLLSKEVGVPLLPYYIVTKTSYDPHTYPTDPVPMPRNHHLEYAITWYSLAFILMSMLFYKNNLFKKRRKRDDSTRNT